MNDDEMAKGSTPGTFNQHKYKAPEMFNNQAHKKIVDWWALGVLIYEMLIGILPFNDQNLQGLISKIKTKTVTFPDKKKYNIEYSDEIVDLIQNLLQREQWKRLGNTDDAEEVLSHPFFSEVDKHSLLTKQAEPPLIP